MPTEAEEQLDPIPILGKLAEAGVDFVIAMKEAAGRPRDKLMASEYRTIADELRRSGD